jgi:hypothetical protein
VLLLTDEDGVALQQAGLVLLSLLQHQTCMESTVTVGAPMHDLVHSRIAEQ